MSPQEKSNQQSGQTHFAEFDDQVLQKTFEDFYATNDEEKKSSIWNFSTIAGLGIVSISLLFILQSILNFFVPGLSSGLISIVDPEFLSALPVIGGGLATITGLGWFRRRKQKKISRSQKRAMKRAIKEERSSFVQQERSYKESAAYGATTSSSSKSSNIGLNQSNQYMQSKGYEPYAISKNNRLFKARREKVVSGVLGGIAKYVGINPGLLRLLFVIGFFMSGGVPLLIAYFVLSMILPKEPLIMLED